MRITWVLAAAVLLTAVAARAEDAFERGRIPHRDGSGRSTILEVQPGVPGAKEFVRDDNRPPPRRGEISLPSPQPSPPATPTAAAPPRRY